MSKKGRYWRWFLGIILGLILLVGGLYLVMPVETHELDEAARKEASGEFIELADGWVHYRFEGQEDGPVIVLVHGFSVPAYIWDPTYQTLVDAGFKVLSFDLYGRGYSDRPDIVYDIDSFTSQLENLLAALDVKYPIDLVGLSMGGPIVTRYTNKHPELVRSITFIAPEVVQVTRQQIFPMNLPGVGEYIMAVVMEPILLPRMQSSDFFHPEKFPEWQELYQVQLQYRGTGRALLSTIRKLIELDSETEYRLLNDTGLPFLLIWGQEDQTISADHIRILRNHLPEIEFILIPDAGHIPHYERPDLVNAVLLEFLEGVP